ncbi:type VI secretion system baseplate subunit TssK [Bordetella hinzii]|uniref:type VI secretion system baseplate subunit TssK n=1 Tax=Bordetella hinzii TaxID=103855 RepID=UPI00045B9AA0|nr:type VI secretion system baseplate subunit TssK [Bordetella hinzii]KCB43580.1 PF05936 family protein [Bordetella hinzii 4161]MCJ9707696.1 type VI secretion system baseplate subunit TssK [Bordetella hinzii]QDJ36489.1 hypothetical protein CBR67_07410 [Bordetella hinzii]QDJ45595.1 hypothetical protein CBR71_07090 [Bordetella hinzii]QII83550.1 type VI secretion system baseplate subunit TssK [Bordetella hinzii]
MGFDSPPVERIAWHEGMLLVPQHLQQLCARMDSLVAAQVLAARPVAWGLGRLVLDEHLLPAGRLRVLALDAILPDGTLVSYEAQRTGAAALELDLLPFQDALQDGGLDVYLTLAVGAGRFVAAGVRLVEDMVSDAPAVEIPQSLPALQLAAGDYPGPERISLLLGDFIQEGSTVKRGNRLGPLLCLPRDSGLWNQAMQLLALMRAKAVYLARQVVLPVSDLEGRLAQLELRARLAALMTSLPEAEALMRGPRVHPWDLYLALVRLSGAMALLRPGQVAPMPPDYSQERPQQALESLLGFLREMAVEVNESYRLSKFLLVDGAFVLGMESGFLEGRLIIGVSGPSERDARSWIAGAIIGTEAEFASLRGRRVLGAERRAVAEGGLGGGYSLFEIDASTFKAGDLLKIANPNEGESASRPHEIVLFVKGES